ncbi:MAG TPA: phosphodiester glycosidase family protein [Anaeromyxobacteraceae bacterium]|nr:phosphodiester glycosidase family protein [Anaeromyxobacteraceae bacterium]
MLPLPFAALATLALAAAPAAPWQPLEPGLDLGRFEGPSGGVGDGLITVIRVDPRRFELRLLNASAPGEGSARSARDWAMHTRAVATINAAMYQEDLRTSVSLMRTRTHVNHPRLSRDRTVLAFDPSEPGLPPLRIIDRDCDDLDAVGRRYGSLVQSIRLVSCGRKNVWTPSERRTSAAVVGVDGAGRLLLVHARTAWPTSALADALLGLPIDLQRAMYVEGGAEAQLFVAAGGRELELIGAIDGLPGVAQNFDAWPVPNVLGVYRRPSPLHAPVPPRTAPARPVAGEKARPSR